MRKQATAYLQTRHVIKSGSAAPAQFAPADINSAMLARKAFASFLRAGCSEREMVLEPERKALSEFSMGGNGVLLPPEISDRMLSCLADPGDLTGVVDSMTISSASVLFPVDNVDGEDLFGWACEPGCAFNSTGADIAKGLTTLELKPEELRGLICATRSLLEDVAIDIEGWITRKGQQGVRRIASRAIAIGSGLGMPMGILNPQAGIPICAPGANTPAGQVTWQDLVSLMFTVPVFYHTGASWLINQRTLGMLFTIADANGRPILIQDVQNPAALDAARSHPVTVSEVLPGHRARRNADRVRQLEGSLLLVNRKALTMLTDPYTGGGCVLFKLFARLGGGIICPLAARLLRIE